MATLCLSTKLMLITTKTFGKLEKCNKVYLFVLWDKNELLMVEMVSEKMANVGS